MSRNYLNHTTDADRDDDERDYTPRSDVDARRRDAIVEQMMADHEAGTDADEDDDEEPNDALLGVAYPTEND